MKGNFCKNVAATSVLVIGPLPPPVNGAAMATNDIATALRAHGPVHTYDIAPDIKNSGGIAKLIKPIRVGLALCGIITAVWRKNKALYLALDGGIGLIYDILIVAVARVCHYRLAMHHHSFAYINKQSHLMELLVKIAGSEATHIVLCPVMASAFGRKYPTAKKIKVLSGAAFVPPFDGPKKLHTNELHIGQLSNLDIEKGLDTLIDLLRVARCSGLQVRLMLAGRTFNDHAKAVIELAKVEFGSAVEYLGALSESAKQAYFQNLDVFVFPTRYINEAQPRVVFEAFAHGVPVITVARSCIPGDVGEAGICISEDFDFVKTAIPTLQRWANDSSSLAKVSQCALERSYKLHAEGRRQLNDIVRSVVGLPESDAL